MHRQAPATDRGEHPVLQREVLSVRPIIWKIAGVVVTHYVWIAVAASLSQSHKAVHGSFVVVDLERLIAMPSSLIDIISIVVRLLTAAIQRIRYAGIGR